MGFKQAREDLQSLRNRSPQQVRAQGDIPNPSLRLVHSSIPFQIPADCSGSSPTDIARRKSLMKRNPSIQRKGTLNAGISLTYVAAATIKSGFVASFSAVGWHRSLSFHPFIPTCARTVSYHSQRKRGRGRRERRRGRDPSYHTVRLRSEFSDRT